MESLREKGVRRRKTLIKRRDGMGVQAQGRGRRRGLRGNTSNAMPFVSTASSFERERKGRTFRDDDEF